MTTYTSKEKERIDMKKKFKVLFLTVIMTLATVTIAFAETYTSSSDWDTGLASATGYAACDNYGAEADTGCYANSGSVIATSAGVDATFEYRDRNTGAYYYASDYDSDDILAEVYFNIDTDKYIASYVDVTFTASYTANNGHGTVYTDYYSDSALVWR